MKSRTNHKWTYDEETDSYTCDHCGLFMRKKAATTFTLRSKIKGSWIEFHSYNGYKWIHGNLPTCDEVRSSKEKNKLTVSRNEK